MSQAVEAVVKNNTKWSLLALYTKLRSFLARLPGTTHLRYILKSRIGRLLILGAVVWGAYRLITSRRFINELVFLHRVRFPFANLRQPWRPALGFPGLERTRYWVCATSTPVVAGDRQDGIRSQVTVPLWITFGQGSQAAQEITSALATAHRSGVARSSQFGVLHAPQSEILRPHVPMFTARDPATGVEDRRPVILYCHGNCSNRSEWRRSDLYSFYSKGSFRSYLKQPSSFDVTRFQETLFSTDAAVDDSGCIAGLGAHVVSFDYRGYGDNTAANQALLDLEAKWCRQVEYEQVAKDERMRPAWLEAEAAKFAAATKNELRKLLSLRDESSREIPFGTPSELGLVSDALAVYEWLVYVQGVSPSRIVLHGHSLGTGVSCLLIKLLTSIRSAMAEACPISRTLMCDNFRAPTCVSPPVAAVVLETPFTNIPDVAASTYLPRAFSNSVAINKWLRGKMKHVLFDSVRNMEEWMRVWSDNQKNERDPHLETKADPCSPLLQQQMHVCLALSPPVLILAAGKDRIVPPILAARLFDKACTVKMDEFTFWSGLNSAESKSDSAWREVESHSTRIDKDDVNPHVIGFFKHDGAVVLQRWRGQLGGIQQSVREVFSCYVENSNHESLVYYEAAKRSMVRFVRQHVVQ